MNTTLHAWFSETAANRHGSVIYAREDGTEVEVTCADHDILFDYRYADKEYVGLVSKYLRKGRLGIREYLS